MPIGQDILDTIAHGRPILDDLANDVTRSLSSSYQAIIDIWEIDCEGSWVVWVETAVNAAGAALYLLLIPSPQEIFESYLEPKPGRRGGRRGQRGERERRPNPAGAKRVFFRGGIPDIDNAIADLVPGRGLLAGRNVGPGEWLFWTGVNVADRALWYWLLLEATETFATTWMSGLLESGQCQADNDGYCQIQTPTHTTFVANNLWGNKFTCPVLIEENLTILNNGEIVLPLPNTEADAMTTIETHWAMWGSNTPGTTVYEVGYTIQIYDHNGNQIDFIKETINLSVGQNQAVTAVVPGVHHHSNIAKWWFHYWVQPVSGPGYQTLEAWSTVAIATRNRHNV